MMTDPSTDCPVSTRYAPSPSGHLHVGGARTALFCWAFSRRHHGNFILRIEDTDQKRSSQKASLGFLEDLDWLGIDWDEGPEFAGSGGGDHGPYYQSQRLPIYDEHIMKLVEAGHAYWAFETPEQLDAARKQARAEGRAYRYDRAALELDPAEVRQRLDRGDHAVVRFKVPPGEVTFDDMVLGTTTFPDGEIDDFIIRKADGFPTYHLAVVVDDALMEVSHVLRAQEHLNNTARHVLLQRALGFGVPAHAHLPLIFNPDGSKMSKRDKDKALRAHVKTLGLGGPPAGTIDDDVFQNWLSDKRSQLEIEQADALARALDFELPEINVNDFRCSGYLPGVLCNFLALNGWSPGNDLEKFDNAFLAENFTLDRVQKTPAHFDRMKLLAFNLDAIQELTEDQFHTLLREHAAEYRPEFLQLMDQEQFRTFSESVHERSKTLDEPFRTNRFLVIPDEQVTWDFQSKPVKKALLNGDSPGISHLPALRLLLDSVDPFDSDTLEQVLKDYADQKFDGQLGKVAQPLRVAVSGGTVSPPIFHTLQILGRDSVLNRIDACINTAASLPST